MTTSVSSVVSQLKGTISAQGSKNAALPMMAASLLHRGVSVLEDMSQDRRCFFYGEDPSGIGSSYLVGGS